MTKRGLWLATVLGLMVASAPGMSLAQDSGVDYATAVTEPLAERTFPNGFGWKLLLDSVNFGGEETRIAELTFPVGYAGESQLHDAIEVFYVLEGRFGHEVDGELTILEVGQFGVVRPGDTVTHSVHGEGPAVVLTIWLPGGSAAPFNGVLNAED